MRLPKFEMFRHLLAPSALVAASLALGVAPTMAGECPADKVGIDVTPMSNMAAKGVTDDVIGKINLNDEKVGISRMFRLRRLEVQPGGVVPWHSHGDRPAIIYIVSGSITEYASTCAVPIEHKAGDVSAETMRTSHWWRNNGSEPTVLLSSDLLADPADTNM
ncbi:MAG: cupin domain-containing protein [Hyphomicrobiaceae bacterium]